MNNRIPSNSTYISPPIQNNEGGEEQAVELFANFTSVQTVGTGSDAVQMTAGRAGNPATTITPLPQVKVEAIVMDTPDTPLVHRQAETFSHPKPNKRPGETLENPRPSQMPRVMPLYQGSVGFDLQTRLLEQQQAQQLQNQLISNTNGAFQNQLSWSMNPAYAQGPNLGGVHAGNPLPPVPMQNFSGGPFGPPLFSQVQYPQMHPGQLAPAPMSLGANMGLQPNYPGQNNFPGIQRQGLVQVPHERVGVLGLTYPELIQGNLFTAKLCMNDKNYHAAQKFCEYSLKHSKFAELSPLEKGEIIYILAQAHFLQNNVDEFERVHEELLKYPEYILTLSGENQMSLYELSAVSRFKQKNYAGAKEFYEKSLKCTELIVNPSKKKIGMLFYNIAVTSFNQKKPDYGRAKEACEECLKYSEFLSTYKKEAKLYSMLGDICYKQKDYAGMLKAYEKSMKDHELMATFSSSRKVSEYFRMAKFCSQSNDDSLKLKTMVYSILSIWYLKTVPDDNNQDNQLKAEALSLYNSLGTPAELLVKLAAAITAGDSNVPVKDIWKAIGILGQLNEV